MGFYLIALANIKDTITINMFMPLTGPNSFETVNTNEKFETFLKINFCDLAGCIPNIS